MQDPQSSSDIKQDIIRHIDPFQDVEQLKAAVLAWVAVSDGTLQDLDAILQRYAETDDGSEERRRSPYSTEAFLEDAAEYAQTLEDGGVSNDAVNAWLDTWGTPDSSPYAPS